MEGSSMYLLTMEAAKDKLSSAKTGFNQASEPEASWKGKFKGDYYTNWY